ncbi:hypothetical protein HFN51_03700 [Rhizobium leguminosarum]|nr:hypothetical protein [Rhizobium leguminosarum]
MAQKLSDLRAKQKALKAEADAIIAAAERTANGAYTSEQDARLTALRGEVEALDSEIDAAIVALEPAPPLPSNPAASDVDAERKRAGDILAACKLVGKPDKAAEFIAGGKSLSEVVASLQADRASASDNTDVRAGNPTRHGKAEANWDKAVARVNKRNGF